VRETGIKAPWPAEGPKLVWQTDKAGYGYGAVAVKGDRLYLVSSEGTSSEYVQALSAADGTPLWKTAIGAVGNPMQMPAYPGARSTPTVDGSRLYVLGSDGDLACLEADSGKIVWKKSLRGEFGGKPGVWAYSESPLVDGDRVIASPGGPGAAVVAFNKNTGDVVWKGSTSENDTAGYASAVTAGIGGVKQYIQYLSKGLASFEAATGKLLWRYDKTLDTRFGVHASNPVVSGSYVYSAAATGGGVAEVKSQGGSFSAEQVYMERKVPNSLGSSVLIGDYLYGTSGAVLLCIEFKTGRVVWEERCVGAGSIVAVDGKLIVHGENGDVAMVEANPAAYKELGRFTPPNPPARGQAKAWNLPVVAGGRLYLRDLGHLYVYSLK
jgi:outer membrane protein assembly factor BamB